MKIPISTYWYLTGVGIYLAVLGAVILPPTWAAMNAAVNLLAVIRLWVHREGTR